MIQVRSGALAAGLLLAFSAQAQADQVKSPADGRREVVVRFGDLNLSTPAGAAALRNRLRMAAERVCAPRPSTGMDLTGASHFSACFKRSYAAALAAAPTAYARGGSGSVAVQAFAAR